MTELLNFSNLVNLLVFGYCSDSNAMSRWQNKRKAIRETDLEMSEMFPLDEKRSSKNPQPSSGIVNESHESSLQQMDYGELLGPQTKVFRLLFKLCVFVCQIRKKFVFKMALSTIPPMMVESQQSQLTLLTSQTNETHNIANNLASITEGDLKANN